MRSPTVRGRLLLMALALVVPATVCMVLLALGVYREGRRTYEAQLLATTRALSVATDRQLSQSSAFLSGLATSSSLASGDLAGFEREARAATNGGAGWILLSTEEGRQLINTLAAPGAALPSGELPAQTWAMMRQGRTVISNLTTGTLRDGPIIAIDRPVRVQGRTYALSYIQDPGSFRTIFEAQHVPHSWTAAILDRRGRVVARSKEHDRMVGRQATPDVRAAVSKAAEGVVLTRTLEGTPTLSAFSTAPLYGWTFIVGVPRSELAASLLRSMAMSAGFMGLLLVLGGAAAIQVSRRIAGDIHSLSAEAAALVQGAEPADRRGELAETLEVRKALRSAAAALRDREAERARASRRQQLMIHELNHRVKNTLATVQSLAWYSLGREDDDTRIKVFFERLGALSRAHDLLSERVWEDADLAEVARRTLAPYGAQAHAEGPPVDLSPNAAVNFSMVLHELATNAAKYGALSMTGGQVRLSWSADPSNVEMSWRESGGPPPTAPAQGGFGQRLIRTAVERDLGGVARLDYAPEGLVAYFTIPLSGEVRVQSAAPDPAA